MNSIAHQMTATNPSRFGMPNCGHVSVITPATDARTAKGGMDLAPSYPGATAWSPPTC